MPRLAGQRIARLTEELGRFGQLGQLDRLVLEARGAAQELLEDRLRAERTGAVAAGVEFQPCRFLLLQTLHQAEGAVEFFLDILEIRGDESGRCPSLTRKYQVRRSGRLVDQGPRGPHS